jgi:hypothetical protein
MHLCASSKCLLVISLKSIIDRAEMDLKSKAEAVLSSSFSDNFTGQVCLQQIYVFVF